MVKFVGLICLYFAFVGIDLHRSAKAESGAQDASGRSVLTSPVVGKPNWQESPGPANTLEDGQSKERGFRVPTRDTNFASPKSLPATLEPGAGDISGRSVLPAPITGTLKWQTSPPEVATEIQDGEEDEDRVPVRPQNDRFVPPKSHPTLLATPQNFEHGDPPVVFQNTKVTTNPSSILEPAAANNGNAIFYTGNFGGGAASTDGGKTWSFTGISNGKSTDLNGDIQCGCDQDVLYAPQINKFVWYRQGGGNDWKLGQQEPNSITLLDGNDPINGRACSFTVFPSTVNSAWGAPYWFDFPAIAIGVNYLYLTANVLENHNDGTTTNAGSAVVRFDLASLNNACFNNGVANLDWYNASFAAAMANGSPNLGASMLFAAHLQNDQLRVYSWPESTDHTGVTSIDIDHSAYRPPSGEQCTVPDGGNPCGRIGDNISGWAEQSAQTASFMWNAGAQPSNGTPFPYLEVVTVNVAAGHVSLANESQIWNPNFAYLIGAGGVDGAGNAAVTAFVAGGSTSPTPVMLLPSEGTYVQLDQGQASGTSTTNRWGDYLRIRPYFPPPGADGRGWVVASYFYPNINSQGGAELHYYEVSSNTQMVFSISLNPKLGSVNAGFNTGVGVTVTSLNGIQTGPITMRVDGLSEGLIHLGSEDLTGRVCTFSAPVKVGSTCNFPMQITSTATDPPGTYTLTVWALGTPIGANSAAAQYALTIGQSVAPSPVIVSPLNGANLTKGTKYSTIGWARSTDQAELFGFVPCNRMNFAATDGNGAKQSATTTADPSFQDTGFCDTQMQFQNPGQATIILSATNVAGALGQADVVVNVANQQAPGFVFRIIPQQSGTRTIAGMSASITLTVAAVSGTAEPVNLGAAGLPAGGTSTFSLNPITPTALTTFTMNTATTSPRGSYNVIVTGTDSSGTKTSSNLSLFVDPPPN